MMWVWMGFLRLKAKGIILELFHSGWSSCFSKGQGWQFWYHYMYIPIKGTERTRWGEVSHCWRGGYREARGGGLEWCLWSRLRAGDSGCTHALFSRDGSRGIRVYILGQGIHIISLCQQRGPERIATPQEQAPLLLGVQYRCSNQGNSVKGSSEITHTLIGLCQRDTGASWRMKVAKTWNNN